MTPDELKARGLRVKPLVWFLLPNGDWVNGGYTIMLKNRLYRNTDLYNGKSYRSLKAAKAAAEVDNAARIAAQVDVDG